MTSILHTYSLYIISKYLPQNVVFSPMNYQLIDFIFELKSKRTLETLSSTHSHFTFIKSWDWKNSSVVRHVITAWPIS